MTRRELIQLSGVVTLGFGVSFILRKMAPLGRDVSGSDVAQSLLRDQGAPREGPPEADVTVAVFTDYQCPACKMAEPQFRMAFEEDRNVAVIYKDWPIFGPVSQRAARIALAADRQSIYPQVHHALMSERRVLEPAVLREVVERAGGQWDRIEQDLKDHAREIDAMMAQTAKEAFALGIAGTPAFLIGPSLIEGALDRQEFLRAFRAARKSA
ncbi:DsbA family protein [Sphingobium sp. CFD-1]|uniref:DsbA family protein n=1 Tax=Sphingobium sp. CFD-1 TaxID=2878545 RepID=UPI00214C378D|nr:DsbA family protein [Sphingobium sp. CFD-1]